MDGRTDTVIYRGPSRLRIIRKPRSKGPAREKVSFREIQQLTKILCFICKVYNNKELNEHNHDIDTVDVIWTLTKHMYKYNYYLLAKEPVPHPLCKDWVTIRVIDWFTHLIAKKDLQQTNHMYIGIIPAFFKKYFLR